MKKLNYLLITSDQQRFDTLGILNSKIKTPNLDRLCKKGILFDRAYTTNPVCTPSRISMLTGHYPSKHGCYTIGTSLKENYDTVANTFSENGYFTALLGKAHFQACLSEKSFESMPSIANREYFKNWTGPYYGFDYAQLVIGHSVEAHCPDMHYGVWLDEHGVDINKYFGNNEYTDFGEWDLPEEYSGSAFVCEKTKQAIDMAKEKDKPFYIWSSFQDPHNPCFVGKKWRDMYKNEDMPVYGKFENEMDDKPEFYKNMVENDDFGLENQMNGKNWHCVSNLSFMDDEKKREIMRSYYGMVTQMDKYIGDIIDYLEENDLIDNTVIVFTSDHGDYMGNHGLWWKGIPAYEDIQKVPYIVATPNCKTKNSISHALQSTIDIPLTFLNYANIKKSGLQGKNQINSWEDCDFSSREDTIIEFRPSESDFMQVTYVNKNYKMILYHDSRYNELYNIEKDKDQLINLWYKPESINLKLKLLEDYVKAQMEKDGVLQERLSPA